MAIPASLPAGEGRWWLAGTAAALVEGGAVGADCDGHPIAIYRTGGELHATDSLCTHAFVPLQDGILDAFEIECPVHQARFDVRTGACLRFPAKRPLRTFVVREIEGRLEVWIPADLEPAKGVRRAPAYADVRGPAAGG